MKNVKRLKPITDRQTGSACCHWRRRLTDEEARKAAEIVKAAFEKAGIEADVSGPEILAKGEASLFGRAYRYREDRCPLWGSLRHSASAGLGWSSPVVFARLKKPVKKVRSSSMATVRDLTQVRVQVELSAGFLDWRKSHVKGTDPREDAAIRTKADVERVDADPRWECETWDAHIDLDGQERPYRRWRWSRYQGAHPFVYAATQGKLAKRVEEEIDWIARDLGLGKYARG